MITYQTENLETILKDGFPLFVSHWEEIARHKDDIQLAPDYAGYRQLDEMGRLLITTARDGEKLVGYIINFVSPSLHYRDHVMATNDILFVLPEYRGKGVFKGLLTFTTATLKSMGVKILYVDMKTEHDFGPLLERGGFTEIERRFELKLE